MRFFRLLAVAVLAVILALSPAQNVFAEPVLTLNPACGNPGQLISFSGIGFGNSEHTPTISSSPDGLISGATITITNRALDSVVSGTFVVAAGAHGSYLVTIHTMGIGQSASAGFTVGDCVIVIEVPYSICVVQIGLVQQDGSTEWIGTGVTGAPISECQNTTEYFTDVAGGTVAFHQFILNGTSFKIVAIQPPIII